MLSKYNFQLKTYNNTLSKRNHIEINFLIITIFLYLFRSSIPLFKYPFLLFFGCFSLYALIVYREEVIDCLKEYFKTYKLIFLLILVFFISICFSNKLYLNLFKESVDILILLLLFFLLTLIVSSKSKLILFQSNLLFIVLVLASLIALVNTYFFIEIQKNFGFYPVHSYQNKFILSSLLLDKNFALLPVFFGFVILLYKLNSNVSKGERILYNLFLLFFSMHILISLSRRGQIVLLLIVAFTLALRICLLLHKCLIFKKLISNLAIFHSLLFIVPLFTVLFFHFGSFDFKLNTLKLLRVKDISGTKAVITSTLYSYAHRFNGNLSYYDLNRKLWSISFDPKDPDNGWGAGLYKTTFPLVGNNVEIVPGGSIGYLFDSLCSFSNSASHAYSNTMFYYKIVSKNDTIKSTVYCYASPDFNGDLICLRADGVSYGDRVSSYDLNLKGRWQQLSINASCTNGEAYISLYFNKQGVTNFSKLTGYVIFAYPEYKLITNDSLVSNHLKQESDLQKPVNHNIKTINVNLRIGHPIYLSEKQNYATLFDFPLQILSPQIDKYTGSDPIRKWVAKFISEDSTYYPYRSNLQVNFHSTRLADERISRWKFAIQIFVKEYNWKERIFGGGFSFLNWYGFYFYNDKTRSDYPHNPFLHILLYSGILGLILYLYLMYKVLYYYLKYIKEYYMIFLFFLITYFFAFFSGGNPFDPPLMGFFVILSFFINSVHHKNNHELSDDKVI